MQRAQHLAEIVAVQFEAAIYVQLATQLANVVGRVIVGADDQLVHLCELLQRLIIEHETERSHELLLFYTFLFHIYK